MWNLSLLIWRNKDLFSQALKFSGKVKGLSSCVCKLALKSFSKCWNVYTFQEFLTLVAYFAALLGSVIGFAIYEEVIQGTTLRFEDFYEQGLKSYQLPEIKLSSTLVKYIASCITLLIVIWNRSYVNILVSLVSGFTCIISLKPGRDCNRFLKDRSADLRLDEVHNVV